MDLFDDCWDNTEVNIYYNETIDSIQVTKQIL